MLSDFTGIYRTLPESDNIRRYPDRSLTTMNVFFGQSWLESGKIVHDNKEYIEVALVTS